MINIWRSAKRVMYHVYRVTDGNNSLEDRELGETLRNLSASIMYHLGEGYQKPDSREKLFFISMAKEAHDCLRTNLNVALEKSYIEDSEMSSLLKELDEVFRMINECIKHLSDQPNENLSRFYHSGLNINKGGSVCRRKSIQQN